MENMQRISARCLRFVSLGSAFVLTGFVVLAQAPPSADTFVSKVTPTVNYGPSIGLAVGPDTTTYIQFNLSGIPAGAMISKATLRLYVDAVAKAGSFDVYEVNNPWTESTLTFNTPAPVPGISATGGNPISVTTASVNQFVLVDITPLAQRWVNGVSNHGVALKLTTPAGTFSFDSKESLLTANGPELEIALTSGGTQGPPGPAGPQGLQGPQGPQGPPGLGLQGPQGPAGKDGAGFAFRNAFDNTASYAVNDVVSYSDSSYVATAANQGPNNPAPDQNVAWSLMAKQGAPGQIGQTGPQGAIGPTGPTGPQGAQGPQGPASTTGQNSQTAYQTNGLFVSTPSLSFIQLPGLSFTVSVPANSIVIVAADGGVVVNSLLSTAMTVADVGLEVDNVGTRGAFKRVSASNNPTFVQLPANWSFSESMSLSPGPHTFSVVGRLAAGFPAIIGDGFSTITQSELTVTILNQ